ncbi:uncharacterized protein MELLADRAFT_110066 [Melampsora larici-populina 98AG31]|uniref:Uncharacterized protein n=1 Tax=Melampsora larici-populina (strain 98AG31 / pathotype 3-4-7) TaxID=747676 RepID=F4RYJ7_MELLP|nr:uncharacterized protein MELLADRAFT_110066 [Melampsora larici-populina 98AG31]EGG02483.1 hypothetical protein MELLADRAFT_110066 [Melampsora larici-populina 98AG31]
MEGAGSITNRIGGSEDRIGAMRRTRLVSGGLRGQDVGGSGNIGGADGEGEGGKEVKESQGCQGQLIKGEGQLEPLLEEEEDNLFWRQSQQDPLKSDDSDGKGSYTTKKFIFLHGFRN